MKFLPLVFFSLLLVDVSWAEPLSTELTSWEGEFIITEAPETIRIDGFKPILLWKYKLTGGSQGTVMAFTGTEDNPLFVGKPNEKGIQPIFMSYGVMIQTNGAEIVVQYSVQGNGGQMLYEKYFYDGTSVKLISATHYMGRDGKVWNRQ